MSDDTGDAQIQRYEGTPRKRGRRRERSRWKRFLKFIFPRLAFAENLGEEYAQAKANEAKAEAAMKTQQAAEIAARVEQENYKAVQQFFDLADAAFPDDSETAQDLKIAKLLSSNEGLAAQLQEVKRLKAELRRQYGVRVQGFVGDPKRALEQPSDSASEGDSTTSG